MDDYVAINRANWDERAPAHADSPDYEFDRFVNDPEHLSGVVRFDRPRLGNLTGLRVVHLQCHIGTDTLSLTRLGATTSGLDFSAAALHQARRLATNTASTIDFHQAELYDAIEIFGRQSFDLVYTGIGTLPWLPDVTRWARIVADLLRPNGRLFLREGHPMLLTLDQTTNPPSLRYPYFETTEPVIDDDPGTYVQTQTTFTHTLTHQWNHGLSETITALLKAGMRLTGLTEHTSIPWQALPGHMTTDHTGE